MIEKFDTLGKYITKISDLVDICIKNTGLGYNEFALFYSLFFSQNGSCTQKEICDEWLLPKQTVFNICKIYREKGWIEFSQSESDKREKLVSLTKLGKENVKPAIDEFVRINGQIFLEFGEKRCDKLFSLLSDLSEIYKKEISNKK